MKLVLLRADCDTGRTCPNVNLSDRGTLVVQGYIVADDALAALDSIVPPGARVVELPLSLVPELQDRVPNLPVHLTGRASVMVWGPEVTDPEALAELAMPEGESAIELPCEVLPLPEVAHVG
ncbi:hypothetical protein [Actinomadura nitritigenes]|uniref:hypothetical protein n=1 Tax=Actinomadura nitritigenes TaxID=134602 RepID=UPI003D8F0BFB